MVGCRFFVSILLFSILVSSCAANRDYAKVRKNFDVEQYFRSDNLEPGYRYYYTGPDGEPIAFLALSEEYVLVSQFWHQFNNSYQLQGWIRDIDRIWGQLDDIEYVMIIYKGSEILSKDKERIGMIYSKYDWIVAWWGENENEIYITPPKPGGNQRGPFMRRWR